MVRTLHLDCDSDRISPAFGGKNKALVYYCATLFREIDLRLQCSTIVEHWRPYDPSQGVKDV